MDFKNVKLDDYALNLDLHKSMFFIDMLKGIYEFTLKGDEVEIFKKLKSGISEPITRKELIYSIQVEMAEKYKYSSIKKKQIHSNLSKEEKYLRAFYIHFDTVDSIHKAIAAQLDISIDDVSIANINYLPRSDGGLSPIVNPAFLKRVGSQLLINEYENEKTFDYRIDYKIKASNANSQTIKETIKT